MRAFKVEIKWAIVIGIVQLLWLLLEYALGFHGKFIGYQAFTSLLFYVPIVMVIFYAIKENMLTLYGGSVNMMQGLKTGFFTTLFAMPLMMIATFFVFQYISTDFFNRLMTLGIEQGQNQSDLASYIIMKNYLRQLIFFPSMGLLFALIITLILKKK